MAEVYRVTLKQVILPAPPGMMVWLPGDSEDDEPECFSLVAIGFGAQAINYEQEVVVRTRTTPKGEEYHVETLPLPDVVLEEVSTAWEYERPEVCLWADWEDPWVELGAEVFTTPHAARAEAKRRSELEAATDKQAPAGSEK